jgi:carboxypeptidase Taq
MRDAVPGLDEELARGALGGATGWLRAQVQVHGGRYEPAQVIARACGGEAPTAGPLLDYLEAKFGAM